MIYATIVYKVKGEIMCRSYYFEVIGATHYFSYYYKVIEEMQVSRLSLCINRSDTWLSYYFKVIEGTTVSCCLSYYFEVIGETHEV